MNISEYDVIRRSAYCQSMHRSTNLMLLIKTQASKTVSDWSADSASDAEYTPQGFKQHPSNPYYMGVAHYNNDPDLSHHAQEDFFDNGSDLAITPKQISIMKSTMRDILKEFRGYSLKKTGLNKLWRTFRKSYPGRLGPHQNELHLQKDQDPWVDHLSADTVPTLMTGLPDNGISYSGIRQTRSKSLTNPWKKVLLTNPWLIN